MVHGVPRRRARLPHVSHGRSRGRSQCGGAAAHAAAGHHLPGRGRAPPRVDHLLGRPGRPRLPRPGGLAGGARGAAEIPPCRGVGDPARRDRLPVEARGLAVDQPARDTRSDRTAQVVARRDRPRPHDRDRDQRAARRERGLPRPSRPTRGPGGVPVRTASAGAAQPVDRRPGRSRRLGGRPRRAAAGSDVSQLHLVPRRGRCATRGRDAAAGGGRRPDRPVRTGRGRGEQAALAGRVGGAVRAGLDLVLVDARHRPRSRGVPWRAMC